MKLSILLSLVFIAIVLLLSTGFARAGRSSSSRSSSRSSSGSSSRSTLSKTSGSKRIGSKTIGSSATGSKTLGSSATGSKPIGSSATGSKTIGSSATGSKPQDPSSTHDKTVEGGSIGFDPLKPIKGKGKGVRSTSGLAVGGILLSRKPKRIAQRRWCMRNSDCPRRVAGLSGICRGGVCSCHSWYTQTNDGCYESQGLQCLTSLDCSPTVIPLGATGQCEGGYCSCLSGYIRTPQGCGAKWKLNTGSGSWPSYSDENSVRLGKSCSTSLDCPNSSAFTGACVSDRCVCQPGYRPSGHGCVKANPEGFVVRGMLSPSYVDQNSAGLGKLCSTNSDCPKSRAYTGACVFDKCVCDFGYHFSTHGCAKDASSALASSLLVVMATTFLTYMVAMW